MSVSLRSPLRVRINVWERYVDQRRGFSFRHPPDWELIASNESGGRRPGVTLKGPGLSSIVVLPEGGFSYGFDPGVEVVRTSLLVDSLPARRTDYRTSGHGLVVSRISFDPRIPVMPGFRIEFRPGQDAIAAETVLRRVLETLDVR